MRQHQQKRLNLRAASSSSSNLRQQNLHNKRERNKLEKELNTVRKQLLKEQQLNEKLIIKNMYLLEEQNNLISQITKKTHSQEESNKENCAEELQIKQINLQDITLEQGERKSPRLQNGGSISMGDEIQEIIENKKENILQVCAWEQKEFYVSWKQRKNGIQPQNSWVTGKILDELYPGMLYKYYQEHSTFFC